MAEETREHIAKILKERAEKARQLYTTLREKLSKEERAALPHAPSVPICADFSEESFPEYLTRVSAYMDTLDRLQNRVEQALPGQVPGKMDLRALSAPSSDEALIVKPRHQRGQNDQIERK